MSRLSALVALAMLSGSIAAESELTATEIMQKSVDMAEVVALSSKVEVVDYRGPEMGRKRTGEIRSRLSGGPGNAQRSYLITGPQNIKGTTLLVQEHRGEVDDDLWLFLPSLGKARRVAGTGKKSSFVGTQYAMVDLQSFETQRFGNQLIGTERCDEEICWIIESVPSTRQYSEDIGYAKLRTWITKSTFRALKVEYYDLTGALYKRQEMKEFVEVHDDEHKALATHRVMTNIRSGISTVMRLDQLNFTPTFARDEFSPSSLGR